MTDDRELTYAEVAEHNSKQDLYMVLHDKVYDVSRFVDEHPGGEEVLLDVGGQDATESFEDVGHSDEARDILDGLRIATLKRQPGDPKPKASMPTSASTAATDGASVGVGLYALVLLGAILAFFAYNYLQTKQEP